MPHFENFDQYETTNPKSGKKKVIPIAPHSMQAVDYRPLKREGSGKPIREVEPPFKDVQVEPVSIRQMEKEFKQAARSAPRKSRKRKSAGLLGRLKEFFQSLFGKKQKSRKPDQKTRHKGSSRGPGKGRYGKGKAQENQKADPDKGTNRPQKKRRRRNRSRGQRQDGGGQGGGNRHAGSHPQAQKGDDGGARKRPRRNRRRRSSGNQSRNPNPKQGGDNKGNAQPKN